MTPDATIIHHGGASETVPVDKMVRLLDGQIRLFRRHFSPAGFWLVFHAMRVGVLARALVVGVLKLMRRSDKENLWARLWGRRVEWTRGARVVADHSIEREGVV